MTSDNAWPDWRNAKEKQGWDPTRSWPEGRYVLFNGPKTLEGIDINILPF